MNPVLGEKVRDTLRDWERRGIVRKSFSPYSSPIVCVLRKDGRLRVCCDFRTLNDSTVTDCWPLPNIAACLGNLANNSIFSVLDCRDAYFAMEMEEESIPLTAICTPYGLYEWLRVPFGLKNAVSYFARTVHNSLNHLSDDQVVPFQDDSLVVGRNFDHHLKTWMQS